MVAIDRNRWSSSIGMGGRHQSETPVAMPRSAHAIAAPQYSDANMMVSTRSVTAGSAGSGE
jgi:hypothetical protein